MPVISSNTGELDLNDVDNWKSRKQLLESACKSAFTSRMKAKGYEFTELPGGDSKEWVSTEILNKIDSLESQKQTAQNNLNQFLRKKR